MGSRLYRRNSFGRVFLTVLVGLVVVSSAGAAARLISPPLDAVIGSHPVFAWELPAGEASDALYVSRTPETTPEGAFFSENIAESAFFTDDGTQTWAPTRALYAGRYWWNVRTHDAEFVTAYSGASSFRVAPSVRVLGVRTSRLSFLRELHLDMRWVTNLREVRVEARLFRGRRLVGRVRDTHETLIALDPDRGFLEWKRPRSVRAGSRLRLVVSVSGMGRTATLTRQIRAP